MQYKARRQKRVLAGLMAAVVLAGSNFMGLFPQKQADAAQPTLTVDLNEKTGDIIHGAAGFLYGVSSEEVPTTNTMVPLKPKVLCTKGALGTEHPYGDALDVAKTFLESGGEQVMMYNSNYYGVFGVTANYKDYAKVLEETIAPAVVEWKQAWKADHAEDNLKDVNIDKALVYIPINEGTPINGTNFSRAWEAYYDAIKKVDKNAVIAGPNSAAYNTQFGRGTDMRSYIQYCADQDCMPDVITWHDLQVDKLQLLNWEMNDFKNIWNTTNWSKYKEKHPELFEGKEVPDIPQICINEYADYADCGVPGRLVNWIARLEDEKIYGCLPFWHQANNLNDLTADANEGNGAWWLYKWYGDMSGQTVRVETNTSYEKLYGVASVDDTKKIATTLLGGVDGSANVNLLNVDRTGAFKDAKKVYVKVQSTAFSGYHGAKNEVAPIMEGVLPVNSDGSVTLTIGNMKFSTAYNVTITEAGEKDEITDPFVSAYQKVYEAEKAALEEGCLVTEEGRYNPRYYLSAGQMIEMPQSAALTYTVNVPIDGKYRLDFIYGNGTGSARNDMNAHNPQNIIQNFIIDSGEADRVVMENTLLANMTGIKTLYVDWQAGEHTIRIQTEGDGIVAHDSLTVTYAGAKDQSIKAVNNRYEAEQADFNLLIGNTDTTVKTETKVKGYSGNGYVTGLEKRSVEEGGGIRWNVVVGESGLYNLTFRYQSAKAGMLNLYIGNTATTLDRLNKTLALENTGKDWKGTEVSVYLQKGINIIDIDTEKESILDYMQVREVTQQDNETYETVIEAENCIPDHSSIQTGTSAGASGGTYVIGMEGDKDAANDPNKYLEFTYNAAADGVYQLRIYQSNNDICGQHSYNTKIIDKYASVQVNDEKAERYFFINTFSDDTFKEKTVPVNLVKGENTIKIYNDDSWHVKWGGTTALPGENVLDNYAPNFDKFVIMPCNLEKPIELPKEYGITLRTTNGGYATVDKNVTEAGGTFVVTMLPDKGIQKVLVNGAECQEDVQKLENGNYQLVIEDVQKEIKVDIYFEEGTSEHTDMYISNAGFGTGDTTAWEAEHITVDRNVANSYDGYYAVIEENSVLSQTIKGLKAGKYELQFQTKGSEQAEGELQVSLGGAYETEISVVPNTKEYKKTKLSFEVKQDGNLIITVKGSSLAKGSVYIDNFSLIPLAEREEEEISAEYDYLVDCGDHEPETLAEGMQFGKKNHVTDQIFGVDVRTGYQWGVVETEIDTAMSAPYGSSGVYTTYQWANENSILDRQLPTISFRYAHDQMENGINPRYVKYRFEVEPGVYRVSVGMGNRWGNSANPDVYIGTSGDVNADTKLNEGAIEIPKGGNKELTGQITIDSEQNMLDVYALSQDATINMNYIKIRKTSSVIDKEAVGLEVVPPNKTMYTLGENFDSSGMGVTVVYDDGSKEDIAIQDCVIEGFDNRTEGQQIIKVSYTQGDKAVSAEFPIIVKKMIDKKLVYFTDAGDFNPSTVSQGDVLGKWNGVTDQVYGVDAKTGKKWGVVTSEQDPAIEIPGDAHQGSSAAYTRYQWADQNLSADTAKNISFRYSRDQDTAGISPRYVKYCYEVEPGMYEVTIGVGNNWGNSGSPNIYLGVNGTSELDEKLNQSPLYIPQGQTIEVKGNIEVAEGKEKLYVYALSTDATINVNYILINQTKPVPSPKLIGLEIEPPMKTEYVQGEEVSTEGLKVTAVYEGGMKRILNQSLYEIKGFHTETLGTELQAAIEYTENGVTVKDTFTFSVKKVPISLTGLKVVNQPDKTEYVQGEELSIEGLCVNAVYSDGSEKEVGLKECQITGFDSNRVGKQNITISFTEAETTVTAQFEVMVEPKPEEPKPEEPKPENPKPENPKPQNSKPENTGNSQGNIDESVKTGDENGAEITIIIAGIAMTMFSVVMWKRRREQ